MPQPVVVGAVVVPPPPAGGAFVFAPPEAERAYQIPPKKSWRWPATCPAPLSSLNRYSGCPLYVTWSFPFFRLVVPSSFALTPAPALTFPFFMSGGQKVAHCP